MSVIESARSDVSGVEASARRASLVALFASTMLLSSSLLFLIQPMFAKIVLPLLGSSASVWITFMLFFQAVLLAGYAYAHVLPKRIGFKRHAVLHCILMLVPLLVLPAAIPKGWVPPTTASPTLWLLALLALSIGAPVFVVATTAPLMQQWFSLTGHRHAADPYFLYGASNVGSIGALLAYPIVVEPALKLANQSRVWMIGYIALIVMTCICATRLLRARLSESVEQTHREAGRIGWRRRGRWIVLAFIPSSLMLGVTNYFTAEISPIPLFWILPLALYLLTFVIAFQKSRSRAWRHLTRALPLLAISLIITMVLGVTRPLAMLALLHLGTLFLAALRAHGSLADDRPAATHLTEFYLWLAVGGILGGLFNAIAAPALFTSYFEYPLMLAVAGLLGLGLLRGMKLGIVLVLAAVIAASLPGFGNTLSSGGRTRLYADRNFFGPVSVISQNGVRMLYHGKTLHGIQNEDPAHRLEPVAYYARTGPIGEVFSNILDRRDDSIGVIGLGTAEMACLGTNGQRWTFFEIDPAIVRIASDPKLFTFLRDCPGSKSVVLGDGRLSIAKAKGVSFSGIVLDAFSSDSIPIHLITREAIAMYLSRLDPHGLIVFHISNRYLDLAPVLGNAARSLGLTAVGRIGESGPKGSNILPSVWIAMARSQEDLGAIMSDPRWKRITADPHAPVWTDDYSDILSALRWR